MTHERYLTHMVMVEVEDLGMEEYEAVDIVTSGYVMMCGLRWHLKKSLLQNEAEQTSKLTMRNNLLKLIKLRANLMTSRASSYLL